MTPAEFSAAINALTDACGDRIQVHAIGITREPERTTVTLWTDTPGPLIGRRGAIANQLRADLAARLHTPRVDLSIFEGTPRPPPPSNPPSEPPTGDRSPKGPPGTGGTPAARARAVPPCA